MIPIEKCSDFELEKAWKMHKRVDRLEGLPNASNYMLLFYAVECGLKHLLNRERSQLLCPNTPRNLFMSHDLVKIFNDLRPSAAEIRPKAPANLCLRLKSGKKMRRKGFSDVHAAWRYGLKIDPENETEIVNWLRHVNKLIVNRSRKL